MQIDDPLWFLSVHDLVTGLICVGQTFSQIARDKREYKNKILDRSKKAEKGKLTNNSIKSGSLRLCEPFPVNLGSGYSDSCELNMYIVSVCGRFELSRRISCWIKTSKKPKFITENECGKPEELSGNNRRRRRNHNSLLKCLYQDPARPVKRVYTLEKN